jgi:hypothetical protein
VLWTAIVAPLAFSSEADGSYQRKALTGAIGCGRARCRESDRQIAGLPARFSATLRRPDVASVKTG